MQNKFSSTVLKQLCEFLKYCKIMLANNNKSPYL